jgi:diacylglycerol kinase
MDRRAPPRRAPPGPGAPGRAGFLRGFEYAGRGVWYVVTTQRNMRVHLAAAVVVIVAGLVVGVSATDWACLLAAIGLVLTAETVNTVVETVVDLITTEYHPRAKAAKDAAAGAVLLACAAAVAIGVAVFLPRLLRSAG